MAITPNTNLKILKSPLQLSNKNQITFDNEETQFEFFDELEAIELDASSYQRKDETIRFNGHIDNIINFNYCMYQNDNYSNKWFYAFIVNMKYVNDNMTLIYIKTDVFQTWQFDLIYKQSFIEREMLSVNEDIPGANLLPEGLETGEYKINATAEISDLEPVYIVAYGRETDFGYTYNGIYSGILFYAFSSIQGLRAFLVQLSVANPPRNTIYIKYFYSS